MADRVVNVCFHGIGTPRREMEPGESRYWITVDTYLRVLDDLLTWPAVRISFDDGNVNDLEIGLPALLERGLTAEFYVLAGRFGAAGSLGEADVKELAARGMTIGTHGMNHIPWRGLPAPVRHAELVEARAMIAAAAGAEVTAAACPLGRYDRRLLGELRRLGYERVFTSDRRWARPDGWLQPRFSIRAEDTPAGFRRTVLTPPPLARRARNTAVATLKRWR